MDLTWHDLRGHILAFPWCNLRIQQILQRHEISFIMVTLRQHSRWLLSHGILWMELRGLNLALFTTFNNEILPDARLNLSTWRSDVVIRTTRLIFLLTSIPLDRSLHFSVDLWFRMTWILSCKTWICFEDLRKSYTICCSLIIWTCTLTIFYFDLDLLSSSPMSFPPYLTVCLRLSTKCSYEHACPFLH